MNTASDVPALAAGLTTEREAVYGYGLLGAHLSGRERDYALTCLAVHEQRRDDLAGLLTAAGAVATPAPPAYTAPIPVTDAHEAADLAGRLENAGAGSAWDLVAASARGGAARELAVDWLSDAAVRANRWGAPRALPGQPA